MIVTIARIIGVWIAADILALAITLPLCKAAGEADRQMEKLMEELNERRID